MKRAVLAAGAVSLVAFLVVRVTTPERPLAMTPEMVVAAHLMSDAMAVVREEREAAVETLEESASGSIDESVDPNRTGLIGPQYSSLFTTVGHLEAKRTTTVPDMAAILVHLLRQAGVEPGDRVAIGASGSFPALMVASLAAAESMMLQPVIFLSMGASSYGATNPDFNMLDLYELLQRRVGFTIAAAAVTLGGDDDVGDGFEPELRQRLIDQIERSGLRFLYEPDLRSNVAARMQIFGHVTAFINVGGSDANLGTSPMVLQLEPGLNVDLDLPPEIQRGVIYEMADRGVPVVHLLNIRGLATRYGIPWDPVPLPQPGETRLHDTRESSGARLWLTSAGYFLALFAIVLLSRPRRGRADTTSEHARTT